MNFSKKERTDRPGVFQVIWYKNGRKKRDFPSNESATTFIRDQKNLAKLGAEPDEVAAAQRVAAGTGYSLEALVRVGLEKLRSTGDGTMLFRRGTEIVIQRAKDKGRRIRTIDGYIDAYKLLNKTFGDRIAAAMTKDEITLFLDSISDRQGNEGSATPETRKTYLRLIRQAMHAAGIEKPLKEIHVAEDDGDVEFFDITEVKTILSIPRAEERGFVAVALFACIRPENLEKMSEACVNIADQSIRIPKSASKDGNPHLLETGDDGVLPEVIWKWLEKYPYQKIKWAPLQKRLRRKLGRWIQDGLRHTGATYYHSIKGTAATARLLTHAGEKLVRKHYAGIIGSKIARVFFGITPESIEYPEPKIIWPSDSNLAAMLLETPAVKLCKQLGCSDSALSKRCKVRGISKPGVGYWTKKEFAIQ